MKRIRQGKVPPGQRNGTRAPDGTVKLSAPFELYESTRRFMRNMPPLAYASDAYHAGRRPFDHRNSELVAYIQANAHIDLSGAHRIYHAARCEGLIVYDRSSNRWQGVDYREPKPSAAPAPAKAQRRRRRKRRKAKGISNEVKVAKNGPTKTRKQKRRSRRQQANRSAGV